MDGRAAVGRMQWGFGVYTPRSSSADCCRGGVDLPQRRSSHPRTAGEGIPPPTLQQQLGLKPGGVDPEALQLHFGGGLPPPCLPGDMQATY